MTRYYPTVVGITIALHLIWATGLIFDPAAIEATALHTMLAVTAAVTGSANPALAAVVFATVAMAAIIGLFAGRVRWRVLLILPQHMALWVSVVGAVYAMYLGQFADGVQRTHWFLIVDQVPIVLIACGHTAALLFISSRGGDHG